MVCSADPMPVKQNTCLEFHSVFFIIVVGHQQEHAAHNNLLVYSNKSADIGGHINWKNLIHQGPADGLFYSCFPVMVVSHLLTQEYSYNCCKLLVVRSFVS